MWRSGTAKTAHATPPPFFQEQPITRVGTAELGKSQPRHVVVVVVPPAHAHRSLFRKGPTLTPVSAEPADDRGGGGAGDEQRKCEYKYFRRVRKSYCVDKADCGDRNQAGTDSAAQ